MPSFSATILTLFPEMFPGPLGHSLAGKALAKGIWSINALNIRDFATDKHKHVDDTSYGGGTGLVMKPDVIDAAIRAAKAQSPAATLIYLTPRGVPLTQARVEELAGITVSAESAAPLTPALSQGERVHAAPSTRYSAPHTQHSSLIILCGRYEGVDERVLEAHLPLEISVGDYVLSGGEVAALTLLDACVRLLPGVIGDADALAQESFHTGSECAGLLEYPHYTKPPLWDGRSVPEVLLSGNHAKIAAWRNEQAREITQQRRKDLWERYQPLAQPLAKKDNQ